MTLTDAIAALVLPGTTTLQRDRASIRARKAELDKQLLAHIRYLRGRIELARDDVDVDRIHCAMHEAGRTHRARRAALQVGTATIASVLDQLAEAVHSSGGAGNGGRGVHRSPLNSAAVELLHTIRRTVGGHPDVPLDLALLAWEPADESSAAVLVRSWVETADSILDPPRSLEGTGSCPACGTRRVETREGDETIKRAAIRIVVTGRKAEDYAVCLNPSCATRWPRTHWDLLAAAMRAG